MNQSCCSSHVRGCGSTSCPGLHDLTILNFKNMFPKVFLKFRPPKTAFSASEMSQGLGMSTGEKKSWWRHVTSFVYSAFAFDSVHCLSDLSDCNEGIRLYSERADIFEGKLACFEDEKIELQDFPRVWVFSDTHFAHIEELKTTKKKFKSLNFDHLTAKTSNWNYKIYYCIL